MSGYMPVLACTCTGFDGRNRERARVAVASWRVRSPSAHCVGRCDGLVLATSPTVTAGSWLPVESEEGEMCVCAVTLL